MCAVIRDPSMTPISVNQAEVRAINSLNEILYSVLPVRSPESRERLLFLLTPEAQQQLASKISDEERNQVAVAMAPAIAAGERIKSDFLSNIKMDQVTFAKEIAEAVSTGNIPDALSDICNRCRGVVLNVEWINVFAWQLPIMHPDDAEGYFDLARVMGGIFYLERSLKLKDSTPSSLASERITALLKLILEY